MNDIIIKSIEEVIITHKPLLKIAIRQKAKFEGWLKFELAYQLDKNGMKEVKVETREERQRNRKDITFSHNENYYSLELKTSNTNWKNEGIINNGKPITKNIQSIIDDAIKLNSQYGIVAFILFPIPTNDKRWHIYIDKIRKMTEIEICKEKDCKIIEMDIDECKKCDILICAFMSKKFHNFPW